MTTIFRSKLLLFSLVCAATTVEAVGIASSLAISHRTGTVCGIRSATTPQTIVCARRNSGTFFSVVPNVSFSSVSGGKEFFCGLRSGSINSLFCWNANETSTPRRIFYNVEKRVTQFNVGEAHVSGDLNGTELVWWRQEKDQFPANVTGEYKSLTSGNGYSCAVGANDSRVRCWGGGVGEEIELGFANFSMSTIVAGDSHVCGLGTDGMLVCKGNDDSGQLGSTKNASPWEFSGLALGERHTCGIRSANQSVVCWGNGDGSVSPIGNISVETIVAGGNLTCAVTSKNFSVICWELGKNESFSLSLPSILPGLCTEEEDTCSCGIVSGSKKLCSGAGVICNSCAGAGAGTDYSSPPPASGPAGASSKDDKKKHNGLLAFSIVGTVGSVIGISTAVYWAAMRFCKQKKVHNSVQPTVGSRSSGSRNRSRNNSPPMTSILRLTNSMRSKSKAKSESAAVRRQRSGTSSAVYADRPDEFTFQELEAATDNFSSDTKIGGGSFGTVYKGKLLDGREVAIKRSDPSTTATATVKTKIFQEKETAFLSEIAFLSRLHHKHLVGFVGFCEEKDEKLLVYEYMKNGALHDHLHGGAATAATAVLKNWKMRIKILLEAARGIDYLHNYAVPHVIHRDIKSSNILLDSNWTARVADFGLSLVGPDSDQTHLTLKAAGTVGYIDPEYYGLHHLTTKSDVYGMGVVMLEVLTGKRALFKDERTGQPTSVVDYVVPRLVDGVAVAEVLDPRLPPSKPEELEATELVAYTAMHCVRLEGKDRPSITDVVANLESALAYCDDDQRDGTGSDQSSVDLVSVD